MTISQPNTDVRPTGAEVEEFVDAPPSRDDERRPQRARREPDDDEDGDAEAR
jgi:hypothetical protein